MSTATGIAGAADYVPTGTPSGNRYYVCGCDFGDGASYACEPLPGVGVVQYCRSCWAVRSESPIKQLMGTLDRIAKAGGIMQTFVLGKAHFSLLTGEPIDSDDAAALIGMERLVSAGDGLIPGCSQTWRVVAHEQA